MAAKFPYRIVKSDKSRVFVKCRVKDCAFHIYAAYQYLTESVHITSLHELHFVCIGKADFSRGASSHHNWLVVTFTTIMYIEKETTLRAIIQAIQHMYHKPITVDAASKAKHALL